MQGVLLHKTTNRNAQNFILTATKYRKLQNTVFVEVTIEYNKLPKKFRNYDIKKFTVELKNIYLKQLEKI